MCLPLLFFRFTTTCDIATPVSTHSNQTSSWTLLCLKIRCPSEEFTIIWAMCIRSLSVPFLSRTRLLPRLPVCHVRYGRAKIHATSFRGCHHSSRFGDFFLWRFKSSKISCFKVMLTSAPCLRHWNLHHIHAPHLRSTCRDQRMSLSPPIIPINVWLKRSPIMWKVFRRVNKPKLLQYVFFLSQPWSHLVCYWVVRGDKLHL